MQCESPEGTIFLLSNSGKSKEDVWTSVRTEGNKRLTKFLSFATFTNLPSCDFFRFQDTDNSLPDGTERGSVPMTGGIESTRRIENSILLIDDPTILVTVSKGTWRVSNFPS